MPNGKDKPASKKPTEMEAAKEEAAPEPKSLEWQGLTLELPAELPEAILFDMVEVEASGALFPMLRTLRSVLGPEQFAMVRNEIDRLGDEAPADSLYDQIFEQYGMSLGESSASSGS